jgi:hypothetical protein
MIYLRSIYTGQCYAMDFLPKFGGYEIITEAEYIAYRKKMGL